MSDVREVNAAHADLAPKPRYVCPDCDEEWDSESSLMYCCNPAALRRFTRNDDDNRAIYRGSD